MELFDLSPDQLNILGVIIAKDYSLKYNVDQLSILADFFIAVGSNIDIYVASFAYFQSRNNNEN
ncbi:hypothetical protein F1B95_11170 [Clostridium perfringens]|nr:hypothetical protein F1B95_11170 [Clostridium perfringens]